MNWTMWAEKEGRSITFQMVKTRDTAGNKPYGLRHQATAQVSIDSTCDEVRDPRGEPIYATATGESYEEAANEAIIKLRQQVLAAVE